MNATLLKIVISCVFVASPRAFAGRKILSSATKITVTDGSTTGQQDFTTRCAASGVLRCVGFDNSSEISGTPKSMEGKNLPTGVTPSEGTGVVPTIDKTVSASGGGSMKFVIPPSATADATGSYFANFSDDYTVQFDSNQEFFIQWRQRFSPEYIDTIWLTDSGVTAWKQAIIGTGDKPGCKGNGLGINSGGLCAYSCTALEIVTARDYESKYPAMYNSCTGSDTHSSYDPFEEHLGTYTFTKQNAMPKPFCFTATQADGTNGNCFYYYPNEWMTFQVHVKLGPRGGNEFKNSIVELYVAREGKPSMLVIDQGDTAKGHAAYNLSAGDPATNEKFGKVWLLPYMTNKTKAQANPMAATWYDELIISRNKIADPK